MLFRFYSDNKCLRETENKLYRVERLLEERNREISQLKLQLSDAKKLGQFGIPIGSLFCRVFACMPVSRPVVGLLLLRLNAGVPLRTAQASFGSKGCYVSLSAISLSAPLLALALQLPFSSIVVSIAISLHSCLYLPVYICFNCVLRSRCYPSVHLPV